MKNSFLLDYRKIRDELSGNSEALEIKTSVRGLIQWSTRGQLSLKSESGVNISAMTGFQKYHFDYDELLENVSGKLRNGNLLLFLQKQLSGAKFTHDNDCHVSMMSSQRKFRTIFDTKRLISTRQEDFSTTIPFNDASQVSLYRILLNNLKQGVYSADYTHNIINSSRNIQQETVKYSVRSVVNALLEIKVTIPIVEKEELINIINAALTYSGKKVMKKAYLMDIINTFEIEPGVILNKLDIFKSNRTLVNNLYKAIGESCIFAGDSLILVPF